MNLNNQDSYFDPEIQGDEVHVIGVGATGSWAVHALVRLGMPTIHVYDFDIIEHKNNQNQAFHTLDVGKYKVDALAEYFEGMSETNPVIPHNVKVESINDLVLTDKKRFTVFLLTDSVSSRLEIAKFLEKSPTINSIIETRLGVGSSAIFQFNPVTDVLDGKYTRWIDNLTKLQKILDNTDPTDGELTPCGGQIAIGTSAMITGAMAVNTYMETCRSIKSTPFFKVVFDHRSFLLEAEE